MRTLRFENLQHLPQMKPYIGCKELLCSEINVSRLLCFNSLPCCRYPTRPQYPLLVYFDVVDGFFFFLGGGVLVNLFIVVLFACLFVFKQMGKEEKSRGVLTLK